MQHLNLWHEGQTAQWAQQHNHGTSTELFCKASPKIEEELIWKSTFIWDHLQCQGMKFSHCTQQLPKALQPQYKTESDLSSFIISLGNQGATFVTPVCHRRTPARRGGQSHPSCPCPSILLFYISRKWQGWKSRAGWAECDSSGAPPAPLTLGFPEPGAAWWRHKAPLQPQPPECRTETASSQSSLLPDIKQLLILALLFCNPTLVPIPPPQLHNRSFPQISRVLEH